MKALTVQQPWAWAIATGHKPIENRTWRISIGELAIHAGKTVDGEGIGHVRGVLERLGVVVPCERVGDRHLLARGAFVAVVDVTAICSAAVEGRSCTCDPDWAMPGQYHHQLANPRPLVEPVACRGAQGLWQPPFGADVALEHAARSTAHLPAGETTP